MIPTILKLLFLTLLGVGVGLCISNKTTSTLVTSLVAVIYIVSQLYGGFLIEDSFDELAMIRHNMYASRFSTNTLK